MHSLFASKKDIFSVFRIIPLHPADRFLLGMHWKDQVYIDKPSSCNCLIPIKFYADALGWVLHLRDQGVSNIFHYLDDFPVIVSPDSQECQLFLDTMVATCAKLRVSAEKIGGGGSLRIQSS